MVRLLHHETRPHRISCVLLYSMAEVIWRTGPEHNSTKCLYTAARRDGSNIRPINDGNLTLLPQSKLPIKQLREVLWGLRIPHRISLNHIGTRHWYEFDNSFKKIMFCNDCRLLRTWLDILDYCEYATKRHWVTIRWHTVQRNCPVHLCQGNGIASYANPERRVSKSIIFNML